MGAYLIPETRRSRWGLGSVQASIYIHRKDTAAHCCGETEGTSDKQARGSVGTKEDK